MIPKALSDSVQSLHVAEIASYLQQNQWTAIEHPNPRLLVFEKGTDDRGKPIQIVLPSQDDYDDTPYLLAKAINLLAVLQSIPVQQVLNDIRLDVYAS